MLCRKFIAISWNSTMSVKPFSTQSKFGKKVLSRIQKYDHHKYWNRRDAVVNSHSKISPLKKLWYLYYIKKTDSYHGCSFGTNINSGASFLSPPILPHGPSGIIVGHDVSLGRKVIIYQQVTISQGSVSIGNEVMLGAGAKVLPHCKIGANVKVGANCVVVEDVPEGATIVLHKPRIILKG